MWIRCPTCRDPISKRWLVLAMPWSSYTCKECGTVCAGTVIRFLLVTISIGVLGYVLIPAVKGKTDLLWIPLPLALTLAVLFLDFPGQIKRVE